MTNSIFGRITLKLRLKGKRLTGLPRVNKRERKDLKIEVQFFQINREVRKKGMLKKSE
jgi:hypothetical protein